MINSPTLTLAIDWADWIWIIFVGAVFIGTWLKNLKDKSDERRKRDEGHNPVELEQMAARRREQIRQATRNRTQMSTDRTSAASGSRGESGNLSMAERIARARAKAQQEQRSQQVSRQPQRPQPQVPNEAQRRALAQRHAELERRRQAERTQKQAQQQAQQRARQQAQQRATQQSRAQRAQTHSRAQAQARQRGVLIHEHVAVPEPSQSTTRRLVSTPKKLTARTSTPLMGKPKSDVITPGSLSRSDLRKAIIMNEVLGKPIAMRDADSL